MVVERIGYRWVVLVLAFVIISPTANAWEFWDVGYGQTVGDDALYLSSEGNPYFIYLNNDSELILAYLSGDVVNSIAVEASPSESASMVIDTNDNVHICYVKGNNLVYAKYTGTLSKENVSTNPGTFMGHCSIAVDSAERPHIVFDYSTNYGVNWYSYIGATYKKEGTWILGLNEQTSGYSSWNPKTDVGDTSFHIGADGYKHISFLHTVSPSSAYQYRIAPDEESDNWTSGSFGTTYNAYYADSVMKDNILYATVQDANGSHIIKQGSPHSTAFTSLFNPTETSSASIAHSDDYIFQENANGGILRIATDNGGWQESIELGGVEGFARTIAYYNGIYILYTTTDVNNNTVVKLAYKPTEYTLSASIKDANNLAIQNAHLVVTDSSNNVIEGCYTDSNGDCSVSVPAGSYQYVASANGYTPKEGNIAVNGDTSLSVELNLLGCALEGTRNSTIGYGYTIGDDSLDFDVYGNPHFIYPNFDT